MRARLHTIVILTAIVGSGIVLARRADVLPGREASWIVRRAQEHAARHSYSASAQTRVTCQGKPVQSRVRIFHMQPNKCRMEFISEPLKGVVVGHNGTNNWRYDPRTGRLIVGDNADCGGTGKKLDLLLDNHRIALAGRDRVADREAYSLTVRPKDSSRIRKRLWMDKQTFVILRQEEYDSHGRLQSSTRFSSIRFARGFPDRLFEPPTAEARITERRSSAAMPIARLSDRLGFSVREPGYVPAGYKLDGARLFECPCECPHQSAYLRYSNGLNSISVFEAKAGSGCRAGSGCGRQQGPTGRCEIKRADCGEITQFERHGVEFVVVADVDSRELRKVADSLR